MTTIPKRMMMIKEVSKCRGGNPWGRRIMPLPSSSSGILISSAGAKVNRGESSFKEEEYAIVKCAGWRNDEETLADTYCSRPGRGRMRRPGRFPGREQGAGSPGPEKHGQGAGPGCRCRRDDQLDGTGQRLQPGRGRAVTGLFPAPDGRPGPASARAPPR